MLTCNMEKVFERHLPAAAMPTVRGRFDMAWSVSGAMVFDEVLPHDELKFRFSDALNIVCGPPGSGKTRLLEIIKDNGPESLPDPESAAQMQIDLGPLTLGQQVMSAVQIILEIMPYSYCLLLDDALDILDPLGKRRLLDIVANAEKQVIMTAPWGADEVGRVSPSLHASFLMLDGSSVPAPADEAESDD